MWFAWEVDSGEERRQVAGNRQIVNDFFNYWCGLWFVKIPLPSFWGGFRVNPETIEFWQGGPHRLHDRFQYSRTGEGPWTTERLAP